MKTIFLTLALFLGLTSATAQVDSPHYSLASKQLTEMMEFFESVSQPLTEEQQRKVLNINIGMLGKIEGVNNSGLTEQEKASSLLELKDVREKMISKNLTDAQKEKYKTFVLSETTYN
jgi:hypothetical protein